MPAAVTSFCRSTNRRAHRRLLVGHLVERHGGAVTTLGDLGQAHGSGLEAGLGGRLATRLDAVGQHLTGGVDALGTADGGHALHGVGHEAEQLLVPGRTAAGVGRQVDDRAVAAGAGDGVAAQGFGAADHAEAVGIDLGDAGGVDAGVALGLDDRRAGDDADALGTGLLDQLAVRVGAGVGDGDHLTAGLDPVQGGAVGVIVAGGEH